ncbi:MAG: hypothetical protein GF308_09405 [Candidatus Heimdallarchaeota archaeon]|nr:hypothetical protein [Candidatus Heimdallarchaeota archaeon]
MTELTDFISLMNEHSRLRRTSINLIASENHTSPLVRAALSSDLGHRYSADFYGGTKFIQQVIQKAETYLRELFNVDYSIVTSLSGHLCDIAVILGFTKPNDKVMSVAPGNAGGYPFDFTFFNRKQIPFSFSMEKMNILVEESIKKIKKQNPKLVLFGSSFFPFAHPVKELIDSLDQQKKIEFAYDGSHVLGLIAGKQFQDPLKEGADILLGSTHKSFPGPQGGILLTNNFEKYELLSSILELDLEKGIRLIDNPHPNRIAALALATLELIEFGEEYAKQIVRNSKALAKTLDKWGVPVCFKEHGFTESHQVIIETENYEEGAVFKEKAEKHGLIIDSGGRIGTSEITRMGMKELEIKEIGEMLAGIYRNEDTSDYPRRIKDLITLFNRPAYCFERIEEINW